MLLSELIGQRVRVHKNLHRGDWSVTVRGKVVANVPTVTLGDVSFHNCESMRVRWCINRHRRKVVGWAIGTVLEEKNPSSSLASELTYNPLESSEFRTRADNQPVKHCQVVVFTETRGAIAQGKIER